MLIKIYKDFCSIPSNELLKNKEVNDRRKMYKFNYLQYDNNIY